METKSDAEVVLEFRRKLGLTQVAASELLRCSRTLMVFLEQGRSNLTPARRERIERLESAFAAGGKEAVEALPEWSKPPRRRRTGPAVPPEDAQEMQDWRVALGLTQRAATLKAGLSIASIRAIEYGRMRITERVRRNMELEEARQTRG